MGKKRDKPLSDRKIKLAERIAERIIHVQRQWANFMASIAGKFSLSAQKKILLAGTVLSFFLCLKLIISSFSEEKDQSLNSKLTLPGSSYPQHKLDSIRKAAKIKFQLMYPQVSDSLIEEYNNKHNNIKKDKNGKAN